MGLPLRASALPSAGPSQHCQAPVLLLRAGPIHRPRPAQPRARTSQTDDLQTVPHLRQSEPAVGRVLGQAVHVAGRARRGVFALEGRVSQGPEAAQYHG